MCATVALSVPQLPDAACQVWLLPAGRYMACLPPAVLAVTQAAHRCCTQAKLERCTSGSSSVAEHGAAVARQQKDDRMAQAHRLAVLPAVESVQAAMMEGRTEAAGGVAASQAEGGATRGSCGGLFAAARSSSAPTRAGMAHQEGPGVGRLFGRFAAKPAHRNTLWITQVSWNRCYVRCMTPTRWGCDEWMLLRWWPSWPAGCSSNSSECWCAWRGYHTPRACTVGAVLMRSPGVCVCIGGALFPPSRSHTRSALSGPQPLYAC
jgi:hypothetical protein